jgi:hypothetical protein
LKIYSAVDPEPTRIPKHKTFHTLKKKLGLQVLLSISFVFDEIIIAKCVVKVAVLNVVHVSFLRIVLGVSLFCETLIRSQVQKCQIPGVFFFVESQVQIFSVTYKKSLGPWP